jgi:hypothetical protein
MQVTKDDIYTPIPGSWQLQASHSIFYIADLKYVNHPLQLRPDQC